jgi:hypothetical protein
MASAACLFSMTCIIAASILCFAASASCVLLEDLRDPEGLAAWKMRPSSFSPRARIRRCGFSTEGSVNTFRQTCRTVDSMSKTLAWSENTQDCHCLIPSQAQC